MTDQAWFSENKDQLEEMLGINKKADIEILQKELYDKLDAKPILTGNELMMLPPMPNDYLVEKLVWNGNVVILLGKEKDGKSILSMQLACAMTSGKKFLDEYDVIKPLRVLYIQAEGDRSETIDRIRRMTGKDGFNWSPDNFYHMYPSAISLDTEDGYSKFISKIYDAELHPDVIFIDPLYMAMEGDLIDNKAARLFCRNIRRLKERLGCTIVICHHKRRPQKDRKGNVVDGGDDEIMGSFVWKAFPSHIISMRTRPDKLRAISCETQRGGDVVKDMLLKLEEPNPLLFKIDGPADHSPAVTTVHKLLKKKKVPLDYNEMIKATKLTQSTVTKAIGYLTSPGVNKVYRTNPRKRPALFMARKET